MMLLNPDGHVHLIAGSSQFLSGLRDKRCPLFLEADDAKLFVQGGRRVAGRAAVGDVGGVTTRAADVELVLADDVVLPLG